MFGVARTTGDVLEEVGPYVGLHPYSVDNFQDQVDYAREILDDTLVEGNEFVQESLPEVRNFINSRLEDISGIADYLLEQVDQIPETYRSDFQEQLSSLISILPVRQRDIPRLDRELPSKERLRRIISHMQEIIQGDGWLPPASERIESRLDELEKIIDSMFGEE